MSRAYKIVSVSVAFTMSYWAIKCDIFIVLEIGLYNVRQEKTALVVMVRRIKSKMNICNRNQLKQYINIKLFSY